MWTLQEVVLADKAVFVHWDTAEAVDSLQSSCELHRYDQLKEDDFVPYCVDSSNIGNLIRIAAEPMLLVNRAEGTTAAQSMDKAAKIWQLSDSSKWDLLNVLRAAGGHLTSNTFLDSCLGMVSYEACVAFEKYPDVLL